MPNMPTAPAKPKPAPRKRLPKSLYSEADLAEIFRRFSIQRPEPKGELAHTNPFTLVVAVALSAQATDVSVNKATDRLFAVASQSVNCHKHAMSSRNTLFSYEN